MLRHQAFDPIERPTDTKEFDFDKYVDLHRQQVGPTDPNLVEKIEFQFYSSNLEVDGEIMDKIWGFIRPKVEENLGLARFIDDYDGARSNYFFPWLINIFRSPATALEISYGAGPGVNGKWNDDIINTDPDDPIVPFIYDDPAFVYNRERQLYIADLVSTFQDMAWDTSTTGSKIVDFGAGRLAWVRWHGFGFTPNIQTIYAFDKDPSIIPSELFVSPLNELGIRYKHGDFTAQFNNPDCRDADMVILGGVASYIPSEVFNGKIIPAIYGLLRQGGAFFFDLQTETPCYRHSMDILDWPEIILPESPSIVIDNVEAARKDLWAKGFKFSAEYVVDTYNKIPSAVMIILQKL